MTCAVHLAFQNMKSSAFSWQNSARQAQIPWSILSVPLRCLLACSLPPRGNRPVPTEPSELQELRPGPGAAALPAEGGSVTREAARTA